MNFNKMILLITVVLIAAGILVTACDNRVLDPDDGGGGSNQYVLTMWAEPDTIYADDDQATYSTIYVKVKDQNDFLIPEQRVNFGVNIGGIISHDITDSSGIASVEFWDEGVPGTSTVSANTDYVEIDEDGNEVVTTATENMTIAIIEPGQGSSADVQSISFNFLGQVDIPVGGSSRNVSVSLYDIHGELIQDPKEVYFRFVNAKTGATINNEVVWPSQDSLSVLSAGGVASVPITSGFESGTISLEAFTFNDESGDKISAEKGNIVISSGPPNSVAISIGGQDTGEEMGSGIWRIECAAFLTDQYNNPVEYGTAVYFSLSDTVTFASIYAPAYVGNENSEGDSTSGVAYTYLNYDGTHTNDSIEVNVEVSGEQNFEDSQFVTLPLQLATIEVIPLPAHVDWDQYDNPDDWKSHEFETSPKVRVIVRDGQQNLINNQEVTFTSTLGLPVHEAQLNMVPSNGAFEEDFTDFTGPDNDGEPLSEANVGNGEIIQLFRFYKHECPPPVPAPPGEIQANIVATIVGTQTSATAQVILRRYID